jgi:hypothetical protein
VAIIRSCVGEPLKRSVMRLYIYIGAVLLSAVCLCQAKSAVVAQNETATFRGSITDTKGRRIRGASVLIAGAGFKREIKPTRKGEFEINLPAGVYKITVTKSGFAAYELTDLRITPGNALSHTFRLECSCPQSVVRSGVQSKSQPTHNKRLQPTPR